MKINKYIILGLLVASVIGGCTESYVEGYNTSPNSPSEVQESNLLTATEVAVFGNVTGEFARVTSIWIQNQAGVSNQSQQEHATYQVYEGDNTNEWNSIYTDWLETAQNLIDQAGDENPYYKGMGLVLKAWGGGFASDMWGDVPFSEALQGTDILNPHYDTQEAVYGAIQTLLSDAITEFNKSESANVTLPGSDDLMLEGDIDQWKKLAWMLKARYANRLSKKNPTGSAADVLSYINSAGLVGNADNVYAKFGINPNNANQWYAFYLQRGNYMAMGEYFIDKLVANSDPRLSYYAALSPDELYEGSPADTRIPNETASPIGTYLNVNNGPVPMVTYAEMKFLQAEAYLRQSSPDAASAAAAYNDGVKASVLAVTGSAASGNFLNNHASLVAGDMDLEQVIGGKYDALFSQVEIWTDWIRTGYPTLVANPDPLARSGGIPYRFPTCIDERLYNTNAIVVNDIYEKPWFAE